MSEPWRLLSLLPLPNDATLAALGDVAERMKLTLLPASSVEDLHAALADAEIVLGAWQSAGAQHVDTAAVAATGPDLVFVQQPSAGVDVLDVPGLTARGIPVANAAGANARGVAEWTVGAALALSRSIPFADGGVRAGGWPQMDVVRRGHGEIGGLRVGILGFGPVGAIAADLFAAFGCDVAYWSRTPREVPYAWLEPAALCARSDILVLALPLTPDTHHLISADLLAALPAGAYVINVGRGNLLDSDALVAALDSGHLGGAALDVFPVEPLPADDPLRRHDRILLSPHAAGATRQSVARIVEKSVANLRRVLAGEPVIDVVNGLDPVIRRRR
ncbi:2-hydroxyacid dehydrogenase [Sporichthya brevicatena]|uniref:2-hydroxyacid dehydrogenase n=1 Tax=Sporichthya brevicatena TaxID=171442 RepID=A0ABP3S599_9ACTN